MRKPFARVWTRLTRRDTASARPAVAPSQPARHWAKLPMARYTISTTPPTLLPLLRLPVIAARPDALALVHRQRPAAGYDGADRVPAGRVAGLLAVVAPVPAEPDAVVVRPDPPIPPPPAEVHQPSEPAPLVVDHQELVHLTAELPEPVRPRPLPVVVAPQPPRVLTVATEPYLGEPVAPEQPFHNVSAFDRLVAEYEAMPIGLAVQAMKSTAPADAPTEPPARPATRTATPAPDPAALGRRPSLAQSRRRGISGVPPRDRAEETEQSGVDDRPAPEPEPARALSVVDEPGPDTGPAPTRPPAVALATPSGADGKADELPTVVPARPRLPLARAAVPTPVATQPFGDVEPVDADPPLPHRRLESRESRPHPERRSHPPAGPSALAVIAAPPLATGTAAPDIATASLEVAHIPPSFAQPPQIVEHTVETAEHTDTAERVEDEPEPVAVSLVAPGLVSTLRAGLGVDVADVEMVRGPVATRAATAAGARALTRAGRVHLPDEAGPITARATTALLAHELVHAVQQRTLGARMPAADTPAWRELERQAVHVEQWIGAQQRAPRPLQHVPGRSAVQPQAVAMTAAARPTDVPEDVVQHAPVTAPTSWSMEGGFGFDTAPQSTVDGQPVPAQVPPPTSSAAPTPTTTPVMVDQPAPPTPQPAQEPERPTPAPTPHVPCVDLTDLRVLDDLAGRLYRFLRTSIRNELLIDRERVGLLADPM